MSQLPHYRIYFNGPPQWRLLGCAGCLFAIFASGGIVGLLFFGWKVLLGLH